MDLPDSNTPIDQQGIIPGVDFTESDLQDRFSSMQEFKKHISKRFTNGEEFKIDPFTYYQEDQIPEDIMNECLEPAKTRYDFDLPWVPGFFSDTALGYFLGGMAIEFTDEEGEVRKGSQFVIFQLRNAFRKAKKFILYTREELISHEACHAARSALKSTEYEEMIAYRLSPSRFRRYTGPIFNAPSIMTALTITFIIFMISQVADVFTRAEDILIWAGRLPFIIILLILLVKNHLCHLKFKAALANLKTLFGEKSEAVIFRLSDSEINLLGERSYSPEEVEEKLISPLSELRKTMILRYKK
ncbi:MAG: hypothetical protein ACYTFY_17935 [Planctomycetota bacterium]|jgi:hypothetical protein